jgi:hypothetical protein
MLVKFDAADPVVACTPFLPWSKAAAAPSAQASASLPSYMMTLYFIPRCSFSPDDTTRELLSRCSPFELVVKGTAWRRIFDAYITSKLLEVPFDSARSLRASRGINASLQVSQAFLASGHRRRRAERTIYTDRVFEGGQVSDLCVPYGRVPQDGAGR